ncbi:MAG: HAD-superfamily hydrolase, subfamily variant 3 [Frankiales bacterium]|nr:HAD-superfamily hydrolase, subfamily variant 3 [Frankiales bacterium]
MTPRALLVDYGGVLTNELAVCMDAFCVADDIDPAHYGDVMSTWLGPEAAADNPTHLLERGELSEAEFEHALAVRLHTRAGRPVQAEGLLRRMFAGTSREPAMVSLVRRARRTGIRTALLSNSWGMSTYDRAAWSELFDVIVLSGEVGMRKPDADIYLHTAALLDVPPSDCVFVDDLVINVRGAVTTGMIGVHHESAAATAAELAALFGDALSADGLRGV